MKLDPNGNWSALVMTRGTNKKLMKMEVISGSKAESILVMGAQKAQHLVNDSLQSFGAMPQTDISLVEDTTDD